MQNYITALKAEHLKKKGTGIYVVAIILGAISPILLGIIRLFDDPRLAKAGFRTIITLGSLKRHWILLPASSSRCLSLLP